MWCEVGVVSTVCVAPDVTHPHIKTSISENEGEALIDEVSEPVGGGAEEAVLKEEHWAGGVEQIWRRERRK